MRGIIYATPSTGRSVNESFHRASYGNEFFFNASFSSVLIADYTIVLSRIEEMLLVMFIRDAMDDCNAEGTNIVQGAIQYIRESPFLSMLKNLKSDFLAQA